MELTFFGLGGAYNTKLLNTFAYCKQGDKLILVDCGEEALKLLKSNNLLDNVKQIYMLITHTHADHIAGLGTLAFYCADTGIKLCIVENTSSHKQTICTILSLMGVGSVCYSFIKPTELDFYGIKVVPHKTTHVQNLECFSFMFEDEFGQYFYTGDSNDFEFVKQLTQNDKVKTIYTECCDIDIKPHMPYEKLKTLPKEKIRLMHFSGNDNLIKQAIADGFTLPKHLNVID